MAYFLLFVKKIQKVIVRPCLMSKKNTLLTFKGICMNFLLELKFFILSHPLTFKQPLKVVQIHMTHPVVVECPLTPNWINRYTSLILNVFWKLFQLIKMKLLERKKQLPGNPLKFDQSHLIQKDYFDAPWAWLL